MDPRERYNDPEEVLRAALEGMQRGLWTALPGIIQSFNSGAMTVTVQPSVKAIIGLPDGSQQSVALPLLLDCPVVFPCGGGFTLTFPIVSGDECVVVFSARCIDSWWQSGGVQEQAELRMHDLSDGFAFVGARSQPRVISGISAAGAQLRSDDGETYVEVNNGEIKIIAPTKVTVESPAVEVTCETAEVTATTSVTVDTAVAAVTASTGATITAPLTQVNGQLNVSGLITGAGGLAISGGSGATIQGNLSQTSGNFDTTGSVTADVDVFGNGTSLHTHIHGGVQSGNDSTDQPT